jgi:hypothetical protein
MMSQVNLKYVLEIKNMYTFLVNHGFSMVDHIVHKGMDYSHITDFRDRQAYHLK